MRENFFIFQKIYHTLLFLPLSLTCSQEKRVYLNMVSSFRILAESQCSEVWNFVLCVVHFSATRAAHVALLFWTKHLFMVAHEALTLSTCAVDVLTMGRSQRLMAKQKFHGNRYCIWKCSTRKCVETFGSQPWTSLCVNNNIYRQTTGPKKWFQAEIWSKTGKKGPKKQRERV